MLIDSFHTYTDDCVRSVLQGQLEGGIIAWKAGTSAAMYVTAPAAVTAPAVQGWTTVSSWHLHEH
jgi:hypothetical protein